MDELRKKGLEKMNEVYGWEMPDMPGEYFALTVDHLFGTIWSRPGLSMRDRRMMLIGVLAAQGMEELLEVQANAILHNEEMTREELREIAIFLTHYVGFPLGSKVDGAFKRVVAKRKKAEEKGDGAETARTTSTTPSRCTSAGTSMTSRYAEPVARAARRSGARAAADRPADRPIRNGLVHQTFRSSGACCRSRSRSGWVPARSTPSGCRRR